MLLYFTNKLQLNNIPLWKRRRRMYKTALLYAISTIKVLFHCITQHAFCVMSIIIHGWDPKVSGGFNSIKITHRHDLEQHFFYVLKLWDWPNSFTSELKHNTHKLVSSQLQIRTDKISRLCRFVLRLIKKLM